VTLGGLEKSFKTEADHQKDHAMMRSLELSTPPPIIQERKMDWEMDTPIG